MCSPKTPTETPCASTSTAAFDRRRHAVADRPARPPVRHPGRQGRLRRDRLHRHGAPHRLRRLTARPPRPAPTSSPMSTDLLDRRLVFVTGKGGVGKTTIAAALGQLAASRGKRTLLCEVDAKGNLAGVFETGPTEFQRAGDRARPVGDVDGHRGVAQGVPEPPAQGAAAVPARARSPAPSTSWPTPPRGSRRSWWWASSATRCGSATTTWWWSTPPRRATSWASSPPRRPSSDLVQVGKVRDQTGWMLDILGDPAQTGVVVVATPEEMPVTETLELTARLRERDRGRPGRGGGQPGAARAVHPGRGGGVPGPAAARAARPPWPRPSAGPVEPLLDGAELAVQAAPHPGRAPGRRCGPGCPRASSCCTCPSCSSAPTACGPPARSPSRSAPSWGTEAARMAAKRRNRRPARHRRWSRCWRPRRS